MRKILVVLSIVLAVAGVYFIEVHFAEAYELEIERARQEADLIESEINLSFEKIESDLSTLYGDPKLVAYLNEVNSKEDIRSHRNFDYVFELLKSKADQGYMYAWIANDRANFFLDNTDFIGPDGYDPKKRPWYEAIDQEGIYYSDPYSDIIVENSLMTAIKVIDDIPYSFVCLDFSISNIFDRFEEAILIDENGMVVYSKNQEHFASSVVDLGYLTEDILSSDEGTYEKEGTISVLKEIQPMKHKLLVHKDFSEIRDKQMSYKVMMQTGCVGLLLLVILITIFFKRQVKECDE
ncbi:hypothetical protein EZV73_20300 [Acidaminobacter sp. JC074]|uniref:cache domain-containing protein n=1 Tax=Acidaminobacter sp. JC074 TaxID=2530199 RepID=UPI001F0EB5EA|nr:cache domain-containing protein [Acidaminobacter sp. JC074]MCH4889933.1 hypothetical protein [Acidaminobacter sp. JC074]